VSCTLLPHPAGQCLPTPTSLTMGMIACGESSLCRVRWRKCDVINRSSDVILEV